MRVRFDESRHPLPSVDGGGAGSLTHGRVYDVIEVYSGADQRSFRVLADDGTAALFDTRGFVVVDDSVPSSWRVDLDDESRVILGPGEFLRPGFWEAYFDQDAMALELFERHLPRSAWQQLDTARSRTAWDSFESRYGFRAGVSPEAWPAISEPADSMTFDLSPIFDNEGSIFAAGEAAVNAESLRAFVGSFGEAEMVALDWQHPTYSFSPSRQAISYVDWAIPVFPNGDYYGHFTTELTSGTFGHPWEQSLCVIGEPLMRTLGASLATWLPVMRREGRPTR